MAGFIQKALNLRNRAETAAADLPELMMRAEQAANNIVHGIHAQRKSGGSEKFWQFREYMPGDRPQDIDWRQSAKTQRVFIRQKEWHNTQDNILWCSRYDGMDFGKKAEHAKTLTLALSILMTHAGERVALMNGDAAGRSEKALENIAHDLCSAKDDVPLPLPTKRIADNSSLILIGDFLSDIDDIKNSFDALAGRSENAALIQVLTPEELDLPYNGRVVFENMSGGGQENVQHVDSIRTQYQERIQRHIKSLEHLCKDYGWHYALHTTDTKPSETLQTLWLEMSR